MGLLTKFHFYKLFYIVFSSRFILGLITEYKTETKAKN
jgi:hypothetical protein